MNYVSHTVEDGIFPLVFVDGKQEDKVYSPVGEPIKGIVLHPETHDIGSSSRSAVGFAEQSSYIGKDAGVGTKVGGCPCSFFVDGVISGLPELVQFGQIVGKGSRR